MAIERSPADVVRLVTATAALLGLVLAEWLVGDSLIAFGNDLLRGLDAMPQWIVDVVVVGTRVLGVVVFGGGLVWAIATRSWALLVRAVVAALLAAALVAILDQVVAADPGVAPVDLGIAFPDNAGFPSTVAVAVVAGVLTAAAPWLSRRWRRAGWVLLLGVVATRILATPLSFATLTAATIGWLCGAGTLVALGAPSRRPTTESVAAGLAHVGFPMQQLEAASVDARGSTPYFGVAAGGDRLFVKALGDDERSADVLFRLYRRINPREFGDERPFSTLRRAVEHEAFVALAARDLGVRTPRLRAVSTAEPNGYVVAYDAIEGKSLDRLDDDEFTDDVLAACWRLVDQLRCHRIAHRDLRLANIFLDDRGEVWLIDFGFSEVAAADRLLATDVAELVASSSLPAGPERAVAHAAASVDAATLALALDRLHLWALSGATRAGLRTRPGQLDDLRARLEQALERPAVDLPP